MILMSLKLEEVMIRDLISIDAMATAKTAIELMNKHEIGCLVIVEREEPVGIVTERDVLQRVMSKAEDADKIKIGEIMSKPLLVGKPQMDITEAAEIMFKQGIKSLPVVKNKRLVGLVTFTDLIRSPNILKYLNKLPIEKTPRGMKKIINTYFYVEQGGRKCPLLVDQGYAKRCRESECMWWIRDECVITKLSRQIFGIIDIRQFSTDKFSVL